MVEWHDPSEYKDHKNPLKGITAGVLKKVAGVAVAIGIAAAGAKVVVDEIAKNTPPYDKPLNLQTEQADQYNELLTIQPGTPVAESGNIYEVTSKPQVVRAKLVPIKDSGEKIHYFNEPKYGPDLAQETDVKLITVSKFERYAGGTFNSNSGNVTVEKDGNEYKCGLYFKPVTQVTKDDGTTEYVPSDLQGKPIDKGQKDIFIPASQVTVINPSK